MFVRIADRIRGIRRIELSSDNFRQQHKAGKKRYRVSFSSRSARGLTRHLSPRSKPLEFEWNPAIGRKKMALFRGILLLVVGGEKKKKKKKNASRGGRRGFDLPPVATRPDRLQRGTVTLARRSQVLTYLLTTKETTKKLHALTRSRAMLVKSSLR